MKTLFLLFSLSAILVSSVGAQSSVRAISKNLSTGELIEGFKSGAQTVEITSTGTLKWNTGATLTNASAFRTSAGLVIGMDVQGYSSTLASIAAGTWTGATSLTTLGTIGTGTWQGTAIADSFIASAATWNAKESALTFSTGLTRSTNNVTVNTTQNIAKLSNLSTNGFVKTTGADGTLSVDTTSYQPALASGSVTNKFLTWGLSSWGPTSTSDVRDLIMPGAPSPVSSLYAWTWNGTAYGWSSLASYLTANETITLSGDISGSGTTAITTTIGSGKVTNTMLAGSIDLTSKVTGALPIANGGTGQTTAANAINALVPSQTGNSGKVLTSNGSVVSWGASSSVSAANPTASIGLTAVNGSATTFMRSDAAPALDVNIAPTWSGAHVYSRNGAVSAPTLNVTGTAYTGGSATTTKPLILVEPTGTTSTAWSTNGTYLGINAASTFSGRLIDIQQSQGGSSLSYFSVDSTRMTNLYHAFVVGQFYWGNSSSNSLGTLSGTSARMTLLGDQLDIVQTNPQTVNIWGGTTGSGKKLSLSHNGTNGVITTTSGGVTITAAVTLGSGGTSAVKIKHGTATLVAGVVTVSDTATVETGTASTSSRILVTRMTDGGTLGDSYSITRTNGASFTITSKSAGATQTGDTSTVSWLMINP